MIDPPDAPMIPAGPMWPPRARRRSYIRRIAGIGAQLLDAHVLFDEIVGNGGSDVTLRLLRPGARDHALWAVSWHQDGREQSTEASGARIALERAVRRSRAVSDEVAKRTARG